MAKNLCILWILLLSQANQKNFQWTSFIALSALPACRMCQMQALKPQNRWGMTSRQPPRQRPQNLPTDLMAYSFFKKMNRQHVFTMENL